MRGWVKVALAIVAAVAIGIPFSIDGYKVGQFLNNFYGQFTNVSQYRVDTTNIAWARHIRGNVSVIREEFLKFEKAHKTPRISEVSSPQGYLDTDPERSWRSLFLQLYGKKSKHFAEFPKLQSLVNEVPGIRTVMISILDPHYKGDWHVGVYRGIHRYLMGIEVCMRPAVICSVSTKQLFLLFL